MLYRAGEYGVDLDCYVTVLLRKQHLILRIRCCSEVCAVTEVQHKTAYCLKNKVLCVAEMKKSWINLVMSATQSIRLSIATLCASPRPPQLADSSCLKVNLGKELRPSTYRDNYWGVHSNFSLILTEVKNRWPLKHVQIKCICLGNANGGVLWTLCMQKS